MGRIWFGPDRLTGTVSDLLGHKAGLGLTYAEIGELLAEVPDFALVWRENRGGTVPLRSEEFEALFGHLLEKLGRVRRYSPIGAVGELIMSLQRLDKETARVSEGVFKIWFALGEEHAKTGAGGPIDLTPLLDRSVAKFGATGGAVALKLLDAIVSQLDASPHTGFRAIEWKDIVELKDLFASEGLSTLYGRFLDQRYIDFLSENWSKLGTMHWRKFEALTAEFFHRAGFHTEIGPGRDDDGVDVRVWAGAAPEPGPPLLLVQCKRTRADVEKVVVKALWQDVQDEGATAGLIVTTSRLSPGAEATCQARGYAISQATREHLQRWLQLMRTPGTGVFLGE